MSRESRSQQNRRRVLLAAAYISPYGQFTVTELRKAAQREEVRDQILHEDDEEEILVDTDAFERLVEAGDLRHVGEQRYELTDAARRNHKVGALIENVHGETDVARDVSDMSMKELRRGSPTGFLYLLSEPEILYMIDAVLDATPSTTITAEYLADNAGVSIANAERALPKLVEVGVLRSAEEGDDGEYELWTETEVTHLLNRLNAALNRTASIDTQAALENPDKLPDHDHKRFCSECGARGRYDGSTPFGEALVCPNGHETWTTHILGSVGSSLRVDMVLDVDDDELDRIRSKPPEERTDRETTILEVQERHGVIDEA